LAEISLTIDGQEVKARPGMTVLEAAQSADIYIPTLCADPDLKPYGGCRLCIVEIEKMRGFPRLSHCLHHACNRGHGG